MRTNVNLADDAREFAELYAYANGISLGEAITKMIRRIRQGEVGEVKPIQFGRTASGFPTFPPSGRTITTEWVLKAQAQEDYV